MRVHSTAHLPDCSLWQSRASAAARGICGVTRAENAGASMRRVVFREEKLLDLAHGPATVAGP